jgi:hypothetical protein
MVIALSLHTHDARMNDTGDDGEPDETEVLGRIPRCRHEEHTKNEVNPDHHLEIVFPLTAMPHPS